MSSNTSALLDKLDDLLTDVVHQLPLELVPRATQLSVADRRALTVELLQAVHARDIAQLAEVLEDWQATAEALSNPLFMQAWQQPDDPREDISWERVRSELDLARDPEAGRP